MKARDNVKSFQQNTSNYPPADELFFTFSLRIYLLSFALYNLITLAWRPAIAVVSSK